VRSPLRFSLGRPTAGDPAALEAAPRSRALRGAARGALLFALVAGTGAYAVAQVNPLGDGAPAPAASPSDVAASLAWTTGDDVASRSEARLALPATVSLTVDGVTASALSRATTVAEFLTERGVVVGHDDEVTPALDAVLADGDQIVINRVVFRTVTESKELAYSTVERRDSALASGKREVETAGQPGTETVVYRARVENGLVTSREELIRTVDPATDEVVRVGTKVAATAAAAAPVIGTYSGTDPRSIARQMVAARGWSSSQFDCLNALWQKESNWNPYAQNPSSGAYGIPQSLPGSKMGTVASDWRTNPVTQITWGLNYIAGRYGTPCAAWSHSQAVNWY
jgi:molybdopterin converting factor small subunit